MENIILETRGLKKNFDGLTAVDGVDFKLKEGEKVGIIGPNGAGKTTFFNLLTGLFFPSSGKILHEGDRTEDITNTQPYHRVKMGIIRTFQLVSVFNSLTVLDNLLLANIRFSEYYRIKGKFFFKNIHHPDLVEKGLKALTIMGLEGKSTVMTEGLSYGDKRKLEISIALALEPKILLLDEPFSGLGDAEIEEVLELIEKIKGRFALIIIEHKISRIVDLVQRLSVMHEGRMIADGTPQDVLRNPMVREVYWGKEEVLKCFYN
jgi:branched-chain amino acid transport system ATP-binding protein